MDYDEELPIIDMVKAKEDEKLYAAKIVRALETSGFLYIEGVALDFRKLRSACEWFFGLPDDVKLGIARRPYKQDSQNWYRGYWPVVKGEASRKEAIEICRDFSKKDDQRISDDNWMYEKTPWPPEDGTFHFKQYMMEYYEQLFQLSLHIMRLVSIGLGIPEKAFEETFAKISLSTLRLIHYPTWDGSGDKMPVNALSEDGRAITTPDHTDTNFLTLLHTFDFAGLERLGQDGQWRPVPCRPNCLVMNIGDTFSRMMNGRFKSTRHRVMDIHRERYSVPFFLEPSFYSDVGVNWVSKWSGADTHTEELYGPWLIHVMKFIKKYTEARYLPDFDYNLDLGPVGFDHENHPPMPPTGSWAYN